jgi:type VI secretion system protein ImpH
MATEIGSKDPDMTTAVTADPPGAAEQLPRGNKNRAASQTTNSTLYESLANDPCSFEFVQAVTLLQRLQDTMRPVGGFSNPAEEAVRFAANPRLGFPASEIQKLEIDGKQPPKMTVNFMGLTGPSGVLPHPYSEEILKRIRNKDYTLAAFFDVFNHRAISLFYRAWQKFHFPVTYASQNGGFFSQYLLDLVGLGTKGLRNRQTPDLDDEVLLHYVSLVAMQSGSAVALEQILSDYFEVPIEIQEFTGSWYPLDLPTQCEMTEDETVSRELGRGAVVGDAIWDRQGRVRIRIGPMNMESYKEFLPEGSAYSGLRAITRFFSNQCIDFEAQLVLERSQVSPIKLDFDSSQPARLGWLSWATTGSMTADPDDTILAL